jgi:hypothetical protein
MMREGAADVAATNGHLMGPFVQDRLDGIGRKNAAPPLPYEQSSECSGCGAWLNVTLSREEPPISGRASYAQCPRTRARDTAFRE